MKLEWFIACYRCNRICRRLLGVRGRGIIVRGYFGPGVFCPGGTFCPGALLAGGTFGRGIFCPGVFCPGGDFCPGGLCPFPPSSMCIRTV